MPNLFASLRPSRWSGIAGAALAFGLPAAALASEAAHGEPGAHSGLPQLDPSVFPTQIFWVAVAFATLYWLMTRKALPVVEEVLETRRTRIAADLDAAASLKDEAAVVLAGVEKAMAEARAKAHADVAGVVAAAERVARERQERLGAEVQARIGEADARVAAAKAEAVANVRVAAADIAGSIAAKLAGLTADEAQAQAAVAAVIKERG